MTAHPDYVPVSRRIGLEVCACPTTWLTSSTEYPVICAPQIACVLGPERSDRFYVRVFILRRPRSVSLASSAIACTSNEISAERCRSNLRRGGTLGCAEHLLYTRSGRRGGPPHPIISAGRRAFSRAVPVTQRHTSEWHHWGLTVDPARPDNLGLAREMRSRSVRTGRSRVWCGAPPRPGCPGRRPGRLPPMLPRPGRPTTGLRCRSRCRARRSTSAGCRRRGR